MAKKGKAKISKVKRNNQTTNKMKKQGKLRLQRHGTKVQKNKQPVKPQVEYESDSDSASGDEWADMLDDEEQDYIMKRLAKQPQLLSNVPEKEPEQARGTKRKKAKKEKPPKQQRTPSGDSGAESEASSDSEIEENYEKEQAARPVKKMRPLLPIKTKDGLMERAEECDDTESEEDEDHTPQEDTKQDTAQSDSEDSESGLEGTAEDPGDEGTISAVELLAARRDKLAHDKLRIGALCSSLLESPEKKLKNLFPILYLMEERLKDGALNLHSIRKLATLSAYEVFKDILPDYLIRHQDYSNVKLKKDTLALYKYEKELLEFYKRYLQRLEKAAGVLRQKKGDTRQLDPSTTSLALVSLQCMSGLLVARPNFNYATNIAQSVIPYLDCRDERARRIVTEACETVFGEDRKGEITLTVVRLINQLVKRRGERLRPAALTCLLALRIRDVDLNAEDEVKRKRKQDEKHKKRIVNLSKKEKKRAKKLKEVEKELLETQAQESSLSRRKHLAEVTRAVFHIYFRLLKAGPASKLLAAALAGLAKFTHVINLEYYTDLVAILARLLDTAATHERLLCVDTVLAILAGSGDAINVDPATFHTQLYKDMLEVHAGGTHEHARIILSALTRVTSRARRVPSAELQAFAKRLATLATQLHHNGALACLMLLYQLAQQSKPVSTVLECDGETVSGRFDPLVPSPSHCGAAAARAHELATLRRHYHPAVCAAAAAVMRGAQPDVGKLSPLQIFEQYDGSQMSFKPAIPPPKRSEAHKKPTPHHAWAQPDLKLMCEDIESSVKMVIER